VELIEPLNRSANNFVGRRLEMAKLNDCLDDAMAGRGRLVMLAGEPGIGKTRIAQELIALAEKRGAQVLWGWCYQREGAPPYWPLARISTLLHRQSGSWTAPPRNGTRRFRFG
jgi:predicted ATPase